MRSTHSKGKQIKGLPVDSGGWEAGLAILSVFTRTQLPPLAALCLQGAAAPGT